jgi:hypothetical protein
VTTETEAYRYAAHGHDSGLTRLDRFADNGLRLGDETELFKKSFCKFYNTDDFNITKEV